MITRTIQYEVKPTAEELAKEFAGRGDGEQARFFNALAEISSKWEKPFAFQLCAIQSTGSLTQEGRAIMREIGEYADES